MTGALRDHALEASPAARESRESSAAVWGVIRMMSSAEDRRRTSIAHPDLYDRGPVVPYYGIRTKRVSVEPCAVRALAK